MTLPPQAAGLLGYHRRGGFVCLLSAGDCQELLHRNTGGAQLLLRLRDGGGENHGEGPLPGGPHLRLHPAGRPDDQQAERGHPTAIPCPTAHVPIQGDSLFPFDALPGSLVWFRRKREVLL